MSNMRKYVCGDCKRATYLSVYEMTLRTRPRCRHCGSISLDPSKCSKANVETVEGYSAFKRNQTINDKKMKK